MTARAGSLEALTVWALPALAAGRFFVRLLFIENEGFKTDVNTYVAWALALPSTDLRSFYSSIGFADYPPGYF